MNSLQERLRQGFGGIVPTVCDEAANEIDSLRATNAAHAQEIDELKAYVNELRGQLEIYVSEEMCAITDSRFASEQGIFAALTLDKTPTQSLATHDAAIEERMIERLCSLVNDDDLAEGLRNMPRIYSGDENG